jgi:trk system potassium uptake protein TrkA
MGNGKVNLVRIEVPSLLVGHTVNEITVIGEISVVSINRSNKAFIPSLGTILEAEDTLYMAVSYTATDKLKSMLDLA